jgi:hypothetical protein
LKIPGRIIGDRPPASEDTREPHEAVRDATMHRIRVGVTGLAVVFLLTILAAAMLSLLGQDEHGTTRLANGAVVGNAAGPAEAPREPLAELGVAPGNAPAGNVAQPAPPPHPARPIAQPPRK